MNFLDIIPIERTHIKNDGNGYGTPPINQMEMVNVNHFYVSEDCAVDGSAYTDQELDGNGFGFPEYQLWEEYEPHTPNDGN